MNYHHYLIPTALTILALQTIYNLLMQGGAQIRIDALKQSLFSNKDVRDRMCNIASRDMQLLKSIRFNHLLNFACALTEGTLLLIHLSTQP